MTGGNIFMRDEKAAQFLKGRVYFRHCMYGTPDLSAGDFET